MIELLTQLDGFDSRSEVKVIMATNKIESLDPALIRPGRIDRKIEFPLPDITTKRHIFGIHTSRMTLSEDVDLEKYDPAQPNHTNPITNPSPPTSLPPQVHHEQGRPVRRRHQGRVHGGGHARAEGEEDEGDARRLREGQGEGALQEEGASRNHIARARAPTNSRCVRSQGNIPEGLYL
jgi:hypothetical protein